MKTAEPQQCKRCGRCCQNGGAALHNDDIELVRSQKIPFDHLITIRKGEVSIQPDGTAEIVSAEFIKLGGTAGSWSCRYYDSKEGCQIYSFRPLACRTLECWDTGAIEALVGKNLINRNSVIPSSHQLLKLVQEHEKTFPCAYIAELWQSHTISASKKQMIEKVMQGDLRFRETLIKKYPLSLGEELFFFGRPFFQLVRPLENKTGIKVISKGKNIFLQ